MKAVYWKEENKAIFIWFFGFFRLKYEKSPLPDNPFIALEINLCIIYTSDWFTKMICFGNTIHRSIYFVLGDLWGEIISKSRDRIPFQFDWFWIVLVCFILCFIGAVPSSVWNFNCKLHRKCIRMNSFDWKRPPDQCCDNNEYVLPRERKNQIDRVLNWTWHDTNILKSISFVCVCCLIDSTHLSLFDTNFFRKKKFVTFDSVRRNNLHINGQLQSDNLRLDLTHKFFSWCKHTLKKKERKKEWALNKLNGNQPYNEKKNQREEKKRRKKK